MKKLTIDALNSLFDYINKPSGAFWLTDQFNQKLLYISPSFEMIWGVPCDKLYEKGGAKKILPTTLIKDQERKLWTEFYEVRENGAEEKPSNQEETPYDSELLLRVNNPKEGERFIIDYSYLIVDDKGNHVGFAGIVDDVSKDTWYERFYSKKSEAIRGQTNPIKKHIFDLLKREANLDLILPTEYAEKKILQVSKTKQIPLYGFEHKGILIPFSKRESECVHYLLQGKSAKQTGDILCISARTVEFHLANAKDKACCRSKLELASKLKPI